MAPRASLIVRGKLIARGTAEKPIRVLPSQEGDPWGTLGIVGKHASGSQLEHCQLDGGSGLKRPLYEFSGMLSIHNAQGVALADCSFRNNSIVDDMVHAVYCEIAFERCTWENSLADALDLDISQARLKDCLFKNSGNDAIDLMTTQAIIENVRMEDSGDKGVSVGEGSQALLRLCEITRCGIGLQAKDGSIAVVVDSQFDDCTQSVDAYKKNWRYSDGGVVYLLSSSLSGRSGLLSADSKSHLEVANCFLSGGVGQEVSPRIRIQHSDDLRREREVQYVPNLRRDAFLDPWGEFYGAQWPAWLRLEYQSRTAISLQEGIGGSVEDN